MQPLKDNDQWKIYFRDSFKKPILFQKFRIFRMPDKRQMGVKYEAEITYRHTGEKKQDEQDKQDIRNILAILLIPFRK